MTLAPDEAWNFGAIAGPSVRGIPINESCQSIFPASDSYKAKHVERNTNNQINTTRIAGNAPINQPSYVISAFFVLGPNRMDKWISKLQQCRYLDEWEMRQLCERVRSILIEESNIQPVSSPVTICGDIHGQFWDLLELLRKGGSVPETSYIFMVGFSIYYAACWNIVSQTDSRVISWIVDFTALRLYRYF